MTVFRRNMRDRYTVIDNRTVRDPVLSFKATGILVYLLSQADEWKSGYRDLAARKPDGESAVRAGLKELEAAFYLRRSRVQNGHGQWSTIVDVYEVPTDNPNHPDHRNTQQELPGVGNPRSATERGKSERRSAEPRRADAPKKEPPEVTEPSPRAAHARDLTKSHWDRCVAAGQPTPAVKRGRSGSPFIAMSKIVETLLEAGHTDDDIAEALWTTTGGHTLQGLGVQLCKIRAARQRDEEAISFQPGRIPPPRQDFCGECEQGWKYAEGGGVHRCEVCNPAEVA